MTGSVPTPALLEVDDLTVEFTTQAGRFAAVRNVSFSVHRGETLAVLGESGSGKSVTALSIMGILPKPEASVTGGSVRLQGEELIGAPESTMRKVRGERIAMIFQDPLSALNPVFTVADQIGEMLWTHRDVSRGKAREQAVDLMKWVGIPDADRRAKDYPHQFSGGMRQRVMIAMALALEPELLIADEPTTALDVTVQAQILRLLKALQQDLGMGLMLITHDLGVVANTADSVVVMYGGRVVESGGMVGVYEAPSHPYTLGLMESAPRLSERLDSLRQIRGQPPDPLRMPDGCPFNARCPFVEDRCRTEAPKLAEVADGRFSACHFGEEIASGRKERTVAADS